MFISTTRRETPSTGKSRHTNQQISGPTAQIVLDVSSTQMLARLMVARGMTLLSKLVVWLVSPCGSSVCCISNLAIKCYTHVYMCIGPSIKVYCIVPNNLPGTVTNVVNMNFELDGAGAGSYHHNPGSSANLEYNVQVYSVAGLSNSGHTFVITPQATSVILFDYAVYQ